jgi:hypothetical protein
MASDVNHLDKEVAASSTLRVSAVVTSNTTPPPPPPLPPLPPLVLFRFFFLLPPNTFLASIPTASTRELNQQSKCRFPIATTPLFTQKKRNRSIDVRTPHQAYTIADQFAETTVQYNTIANHLFRNHYIKYNTIANHVFPNTTAKYNTIADHVFRNQINYNTLPIMFS